MLYNIEKIYFDFEYKNLKCFVLYMKRLLKNRFFGKENSNNRFKNILRNIRI
jgi:hypothetical protein